MRERAYILHFLSLEGMTFAEVARPGLRYPCVLGITADQLAGVEIVGDDSTLASVSVLGCINHEDSKIDWRTGKLIGRIVNTLVPTWSPEGLEEWLLGKLAILLDKPEESITTQYGDRVIRLSYLPEPQILRCTIETGANYAPTQTA